MIGVTVVQEMFLVVCSQSIRKRAGSLARLAPEFHFASLIPGADGKELYGIDVRDTTWSSVGLVRLNAITGEVLAKRNLTAGCMVHRSCNAFPGTWFQLGLWKQRQTLSTPDKRGNQSGHVTSLSGYPTTVCHEHERRKR